MIHLIITTVELLLLKLCLNNFQVDGEFDCGVVCVIYHNGRWWTWSREQWQRYTMISLRARQGTPLQRFVLFFFFVPYDISTWLYSIIHTLCQCAFYEKLNFFKTLTGCKLTDWIHIMPIYWYGSHVTFSHLHEQTSWNQGRSFYHLFFFFKSMEPDYLIYTHSRMTQVFNIRRFTN